MNLHDLWNGVYCKSLPSVVFSLMPSIYLPISPCLHLGDWLRWRLSRVQGIGLKKILQEHRRPRPNVPSIHFRGICFEYIDLYRSIETISGPGSGNWPTNLPQNLQENQHVGVSINGL